MKRRSLLKTSAVAAAALGASPLRTRAASSQRPNVIVILTDDPGQGELAITGNPVLKTPHLDQLGKEAVRFSDFHVSGDSTPTRSQLLTGNDCLHNMACAVTAGRTRMRRDMPTMAELFRQDGYTTGLFGKWHLGHSYPDRPMDRGFDKSIWFRGSGLQSALEFDNDYNNPRYLDGTVTKRASGYCTDLWFNEAIAWMGQQQEIGQPFLVYLASNTPHLPLWPPAGYADRYKGQVDDDSAALFAMIANLDDNIGRLEQWLLASGARENTIVVLLGSNGATTNRKLADPASPSSEAAHRADCLLRWPGGGFAEGLEVTTPAQVQDILPTLLDLCAVPAGANRFDGASLAPLALRGELAERMFVVQYGLRQRPLEYAATVIWNQWRLQQGTALYDIQTDPAQAHNLATEYPEVTVRMRNFYDEWWQQLEPDLSGPLPLFIGAGVESPEPLASIDWWEVDAAELNAVSTGSGGPRGGAWHVQVFTAGEYEVELRRWPFHTAKALGSQGPRQTVNGRALNHPVLTIPAREGILALNGSEQRVSTTAEALGVKFRIRLARGPARLQGWFADGAGNDLCGAYYAQLTRLS